MEGASYGPEKQIDAANWFAFFKRPQVILRVIAWVSFLQVIKYLFWSDKYQTVVRNTFAFSLPSHSQSQTLIYTLNRGIDYMFLFLT